MQQTKPQEPSRIVRPTVQILTPPQGIWVPVNLAPNSYTIPDPEQLPAPGNLFLEQGGSAYQDDTHVFDENGEGRILYTAQENTPAGIEATARELGSGTVERAADYRNLHIAHAGKPGSAGDARTLTGRVINIGKRAHVLDPQTNRPYAGLARAAGLAGLVVGAGLVGTGALHAGELTPAQVAADTPRYAGACADQVTAQGPNVATPTQITCLPGDLSGTPRLDVILHQDGTRRESFVSTGGTDTNNFSRDPNVAPTPTIEFVRNPDGSTPNVGNGSANAVALQYNGQSVISNTGLETFVATGNNFAAAEIINHNALTPEDIHSLDVAARTIRGYAFDGSIGSAPGNYSIRLAMQRNGPDMEQRIRLEVYETVSGAEISHGYAIGTVSMPKVDGRITGNGIGRIIENHLTDGVVGELCVIHPTNTGYDPANSACFSTNGGQKTINWDTQLAGTAYASMNATTGNECVASDTVMCLPGRVQGNNILEPNRFEITMHYTNGQGFEGESKVTPLDSVGIIQGGMFYYTNPRNPEVLVKILGACVPQFNNKFWVFLTAGTNLGFDVSITDRYLGETRVYSNPIGQGALPIQSTADGFPCD